MHGKVALWEEKQNGFEILMTYNMIQGTLRNTREGLHVAESMQTSNENPYALIFFIPETIILFIQLQEQDVETTSQTLPQPSLLQCNFMKFIKTSLALAT